MNYYSLLDNNGYVFVPACIVYNKNCVHVSCSILYVKYVCPVCVSAVGPGPWASGG